MVNKKVNVNIQVNQLIQKGEPNGEREPNVNQISFQRIVSSISRTSISLRVGTKHLRAWSWVGSFANKWPNWGPTNSWIPPFTSFWYPYYCCAFCWCCWLLILLLLLFWIPPPPPPHPNDIDLPTWKWKYVILKSSITIAGGTGSR